MTSDKTREIASEICGTIIILFIGAHLSALTLLFVGLRLTDNIAWSWVGVLSPLWMPVAAFIGIFALVCVVVLIMAAGARLSVSIRQGCRKWRKRNGRDSGRSA